MSEQKSQSKIMTFTTKALIHEGTKKLLYISQNNDKLTMSFKDSVPEVPNSGIFWNLMNEQLFQLLTHCSIPNQYVAKVSLREQEVYNTSVFPFYVRITNIVTEPLHAVFDMETGTVLSKPLLEFMINKNGQKHIIEQSYLQMFDWCEVDHIEQIKKQAFRVNDVLQSFFYHMKVKVSHCYLRFGLFEPQYSYMPGNKPSILLINDLTPYNVVLWSEDTYSMLPVNKELMIKLAEYMKIHVIQE